MIRKRYRVTVDVDVEIEDITMEKAEARSAERAATYAARKDPWGFEPFRPTQADIDACRALQLELLNDPSLLDDWLRQAALGDVAHELSDSVDSLTNETRVLKVGIERLPWPAQEWWRETLTDDDKIDRIDEFYRGLHTRMGAVEVEETGGA